MMTRVMHVGALAALSVLVLSLGASCAGERRAAPKAGMGGMNDITLRLTPGPAYKFTSRWFIFPVAIYPQVACWLETPQGEYVDTLYVTAKGAERTWVSAPPGGRPEALPVWSHLPKTVQTVTYSYQGRDRTWVTPVEHTALVAVPRPPAFDGSYAQWHSAPFPLLQSYDAHHHLGRAQHGQHRRGLPGVCRYRAQRGLAHELHRDLRRLWLDELPDRHDQQQDRLQQHPPCR